MFIVIEGIDGAGCETQAKLVFEKLKNNNVRTGQCPVPTLIKYPNYDNPFGQIIKKFLYNDQKLTPKEQFLLYSMQFIFDAEKIKQIQLHCHSHAPPRSGKYSWGESGNPINNGQIDNWIPGSSPRMTKRANNGTILIADRYFTTTLCYQVLEGIDENIALRFAKDFGIIVPDKVFFLDVSVETAVKRKFGEDKIKNFREKDIEFIKKTQVKYQDLIKRQVWTEWVKIDGERKPELIAKDIVDNVIANE